MQTSNDSWSRTCYHCRRVSHSPSHLHVARRKSLPNVIESGSATIGAIEGLREKGFNGKITVLTLESHLPIDRTKLSKALIADEKKIEWRNAQHFSEAGVDFHLSTEVISVDFKNHKLKTSSGGEFGYSKVLFCTGGTPRSLSMPGFKDLKGIFALRGIEDAQKINSSAGGNGKKIVVVGTGFIGR